MHENECVLYPVLELKEHSGLYNTEGTKVFLNEVED